MTDHKGIHIELPQTPLEPGPGQLFDYPYENCNKKGNYVQKYQSKNRKITSNRPDYDLPDNSIQTSKYTYWNFIPKQLWEQFSKLANVYFVVSFYALYKIIGALQMVPQVTISSSIPTIYLPLVVILLVSAVKDFYEDFKRHKQDTEENHSCIRDLNSIEIEQSTIRVGQIIKVLQDEVIPADMVILKSSDLKGICYVETKSLDGETNLKQKNVHAELLTYYQNEKFEKQCILKYQAPNPYLYKFTGEMTLETGKRIPINFNNFLLRGCCLRNVKSVMGLVAYTGHDTKIMMNSFKAQSKKSKLEILMQRQIIYIFIIQMMLCLVGCLIYSITYKKYRNQFEYLDITPGSNEDQFGYNFFVRLGNWLLIFTNFVPISLLVTLEMVKFIQGKLMTMDESLKSPSVQSSNLNEELGQIQHVFSDKTGTLTCNIMEFKQVIIGDQNYGKSMAPNDPNYITNDEMKNFPVVKNVDFRDRRLVDIIDDSMHEKHAQILDCIFMLASCHTVLTDTKDGNLIYNASSPDELALLNFARFVGVEFQGTDQNNIMRIKFKNQIHELQILEVFEFTSTRKRQSVLVRILKQNLIVLYCKGADSVLLDGVRLSSTEIDRKDYLNNLNEALKDCGEIGLRTLVLCRRFIDEQSFDEWNERYKVSCTALENREEKMQALQDELETKFEIVGATAIEDKLQDKVADTIEAIKQAGIKVWVLTGDKIETAINIGFSCKLLTNNLRQHVIDEKEEAMIIHRLHEISVEIKNNPQEECAMIISGDALLHALKPDIQGRLMDIGEICKVVLCCRVSPKQKQDVVTLVRTVNPHVSTLAIGDGANDVNMITAAHVGIGIRGVEGQQAARAADYAVSEFKELRRLLFYHGRECYRRNSVLVCYTFYKNLLLVLPQFWFGIVSLYSAQSLYDTFIYQLFNLLYGALPIIIYGIFDQEYDADTLTQNKDNFYKQGPQGLLFNQRIFWWWCFNGVWQAAAICFIPAYSLTCFVSHDGYTQHLWAQGTMIFGMVVVVCNMKILISSNTYPPALIVSIVFSLIAYLISWVILDAIPSAEAYVVLAALMSTPNFHLGNCLILGGVCGIDIALKFMFSGALLKMEIEDSVNVVKEGLKKSAEVPQQTRGKLLPQKAHLGFAFNSLEYGEIDQEKEELYKY